MYEKYVQTLCEMHEEWGNALEQGHALFVHQSILDWTDMPLEPLMVRNIKSPEDKHKVYLEGSTERMRKIRLCKMAIEAFDRAQAWEECLKICQFLAEAYSKRLFMLGRLVEVHQQMAQYYQRIQSEDRIFNAYYRVFLHGDGFSEELRGRQFVFRSGDGLNPESVRDFTERIKARWSDATVANSSDPPTDEQLALPQFIQITTLTPSSPEEMDGLPSQWHGLDVDPPARLKRFYENNGVRVFYYTRMLKDKKDDKAVNEYASLWIEQTFLEIGDKLPGLRRVANVLNEKRVQLTPIEVAVQQLYQKNMELKAIVENATFDVNAGKKVDVNTMSMMLAGVIDAAVQGGINKYREAFFTADFARENPDLVPFQAAFKQQLGLQLPLLQRGLKFFRANCDQSLMPLYEHLAAKFKEMVTDLSESQLVSANAHHHTMMVSP
eukprot:TRINITY_DN67895_c10_g3_i1.p1 TRINITY_DN67895_c10_g3~~TRINITY_DN67895_c10_g3_i1.p1  ORF type:complete len:438 (+),score=274.69 TRINITY_DN67895_c10_g3_i1:233-1546(+)